MLEINPTQVIPEFTSLFDRNVPAGLRSFAVMGGGITGRIFTDDLLNPTRGFVWEKDDGTLYQGGVSDSQQLAEMVHMIRLENPVALGFWDGDPCVDNFPPDPDAGAECIEMVRPANGSDLAPFLILPPGFEVFRMSGDMIEKSPHLNATLARYGSLEACLSKSLQVCILHGDEYVSQAGADMDVGGMREAGIFTEPAYRRGGFGTMAVAHLLKWCDELDCATSWNCVRLNIGSLKMARRLGYTDERAFKLLGWFPPVEEVSIK
jgi:GNAT superfamily N-acetyltransferase